MEGSEPEPEPPDQEPDPEPYKNDAALQHWQLTSKKENYKKKHLHNK
jgi:hypothetical protein